MKETFIWRHSSTDITTLATKDVKSEIKPEVFKTKYLPQNVELVSIKMYKTMSMVKRKNKHVWK